MPKGLLLLSVVLKLFGVEITFGQNFLVKVVRVALHARSASSSGLLGLQRLNPFTPKSA